MDVLVDPSIREIAVKHGATTAQVCGCLCDYQDSSLINMPLTLLTDLHSVPASPRVGGDPQVCDSRQDQGKPQGH